MPATSTQGQTDRAPDEAHAHNGRTPAHGRTRNKSGRAGAWDRWVAIAVDATGRPIRYRPGLSATACSRERNSSMLNSRHSPGPSDLSAMSPTRVRTRRTTGWPTASHMRRT